MVVYPFLFSLPFFILILHSPYFLLHSLLIPFPTLFPSLFFFFLLAPSLPPPAVPSALPCLLLLFLPSFLSLPSSFPPSLSPTLPLSPSPHPPFLLLLFHPPSPSPPSLSSRPSEIQFPSTVTNMQSGTWVMSGSGIMENGDTIQDNFGRSLDSLKVPITLTPISLHVGPKFVLPTLYLGACGNLMAPVQSAKVFPRKSHFPQIHGSFLARKFPSPAVQCTDNVHVQAIFLSLILTTYLRINVHEMVVLHFLLLLFVLFICCFSW